MNQPPEIRQLQPLTPVPTGVAEFDLPDSGSGLVLNEPAEVPPVRRSLVRQGVGLGVAASIGAAVFYALTNALMRQVATNVDPWLPQAMRASVTLLFFLPFFLMAGVSGRRLFPDRWGFGCLVAVSVLSQLAGNVTLQYAMGVLGVALTIPVCTGAMVILGAVLGRYLLGERLDLRLWIGLAVLVTSVFLFQVGSEPARAVMIVEQKAGIAVWSAGAAILASIIAGGAFAALSVTIRSVTKGSSHPLAPIMIVSAVGVTLLWPGVLWRETEPGLAGVHAWQWQVMFAAGMGNALAFLCLTTALRNLPVNQVNAINVSQVALSALAGVWFFSEPSSIWLGLGLLVMGIGFGCLYIGKPRKKT